MKTPWLKSFVASLLSLTVILPTLSLAEDGSVVRTGNVEIELASAYAEVAPGQQFFIGLAMTHDENWHTYWLNAGDSGQHLKVEWQNDPSILISDIIWPTPEVIPTPPLTSYGYTGSILLPMFAKVPENVKAGSKIRLNAKAKWLECADICLPNSADLTLTLKVNKTPVKNEQWSEIFDVLVANKTPLSVNDWQPRVLYGAKTLSLEFNPTGVFARKPYVFRFIPLEEGVIDDSAEQEIMFDPETKTYRMVLQRDAFHQKTPEELEGLLLFDDGGFNRSLIFKAATNATGLSKQSINLEGTSHTASSLWVALVFAFIGGLILNLMPCVLPVLAIKITHLVQNAKKVAVWKHGVAFAVGVLVTFWVLALGLIALKQAGHILGWGFQLQNPVFVLVISVVLFAVALDLMGVYEIGTSFTKLANKGGKAKGFLGSFLTGVLATVVATPCTAPFMGSALAFTLDKNAVVMLLVFSSLGLGLAAPYVLLTVQPKLLSFLPKPGAWMVTFKQILAFPVLATIVWLLWLMGQQTDANGMLVALGVLFVVALALWIFGRFAQDLTKTTRSRMIAGFVALLIASAALISGAQMLQTLSGAAKPAAELSYEGAEVFYPGLAEALQAEGVPSFVIFTADWCITCKVNEKTVLKSDEIQQLFKENGVKIIIADWTNENKAITETLAFHGRAGVPFYLYYPSQKGAAPIALPELISKADIKKALGIK